MKAIKTPLALWSCASLTSFAFAQPVLTPDQKFWTQDDRVHAILPIGDTVYIGGDFTYVGPRPGPAAEVSAGPGQQFFRMIPK